MKGFSLCLMKLVLIIKVSKFGTKTYKSNTYVTNTRYYFEIRPETDFNFPFVISGSSKDKVEAIESFTMSGKDAFSLVSTKKDRFLNINEHAKLTLNDKDLEKTFRWLKYDTDWLTLHVDGIGKSLCAGLPDYPFFFGCDMSYTLKGLICTGRKDIAYSTIDLINGISEKTNGNGRIIHEVSTNGAVNNPGNVNETPQFIAMLWDVFRWTGDIDFLKKYYPSVEKGLNWLLKENDRDGNLIPDGNGMMEISELNSEMIDVAVYAQEAFSDAARMAAILGKDSMSNDYNKNAALLKGKINKDFWSKDFNSYADFISTKEQALKLVDDAKIRSVSLKNSWAVAELHDVRKRLKQILQIIAKSF